MKADMPLSLCLTIVSTSSLAEPKQSPPASSIQPGTTILTLTKMCQENATVGYMRLARPIFAVCLMGCSTRR
jgi:hypothetical protein